MQFEKRFKSGIREGAITLTFRAWKRPQAKVDGRYRLHPTGTIQVDALTPCRRREISAAEARRAGFDSRKALFAYLDRKGSAGDRLFRVAFHYDGDVDVGSPDTRPVVPTEVDALRARLERMDRLSSRGPWTAQALELIRALPATRAAELAHRAGLETQVFKTNVRKLKKLGLTHSLETGYRLSPRGEQLLNDRSA